MRLAAIGDIHEAWTDADTAWFDANDYDVVLFTGDLPGPSHRATLAVAARIAKLQTPGILIPGNHDGTAPSQLVAELLGSVATRLTASGQPARVDALDAALGPVQLAGYSTHPIETRSGALTVIGARPHAMLGGDLSFAPYLRQRFGVDSLQASKERLRSCVDQSSDRVLFLAHNGPSGISTGPAGIWGWKRRADNGDPDLADAIAYARHRGKQVVAVVAGHMHHTGNTGDRRWFLRRDGVLYINAARVPRIFTRRRDRTAVRHHVRIVSTAGRTLATEVLVPEDPP